MIYFFRAAIRRVGPGPALLLCLLAAPPGSANQPDLRLVSADAAVTEILFALDAGKQLVAVDVTSELPPSMPDLPRLGYHRALAAEGILALNPDLVIGSEHMGPPHTVDALSRAGIALLQLPAATTPATLDANISAIASALGVAPQDVPALAELAPASANLPGQYTAHLAVAFLLNSEGGKLRMAGSSTAADAFISLLGARNAAGFANYRSVSAEALLELDPDVILIADVEQAGIDALLQRHKVLGHARAARNGLALAVDARALVAGISLGAMDEAARLLPRLQEAAGAP